MIAGPQGIQLYSESFGDTEAPVAIVCVHGGLQALQCWHKQYPVLAQKAFVVGYDLPHHGLSTWAPDVPVTPELWADGLHAILQGHGLLQRPVVLLGWSFGGIVIHNYLLHYREQANIQGLVLAASMLAGLQGMFPETEAASPGVRALMDLASADKAIQLRGFEAFTSLLTYTPLSPEHLHMCYGYGANALHRGKLLTADAVMQSIAPDASGTFLSTLSIPTLLIQGEQDALFPAAQTRALASLLPDARLKEYPDCGHWSFFECADQFNQDVLEFLDSLLLA